MSTHLNPSVHTRHSVLNKDTTCCNLPVVAVDSLRVWRGKYKPFRLRFKKYRHGGGVKHRRGIDVLLPGTNTNVHGSGAVHKEPTYMETATRTHEHTRR